MLLLVLLLLLPLHVLFLLVSAVCPAAAVAADVVVRIKSSHRLDQRLGG